MKGWAFDLSLPLSASTYASIVEPYFILTICLYVQDASYKKHMGYEKKPHSKCIYPIDEELNRWHN